MSRQLDSTGLKRLHRSWRRRTDGRVALLLDHVQSPFNVGAILRTAAAFTVDHLWLVGDTASPTDAKTAKTALGSQRFVEWTWHDTAAEAVAAARDDGYRLVAIELTDDAIPLPEAGARRRRVPGPRPRGPRPVPAATLAACDEVAYIPQLGRIGSLNVATATAIALYEAAAPGVGRRRRPHRRLTRRETPRPPSRKRRWPGGPGCLPCDAWPSRASARSPTTSWRPTSTSSAPPSSSRPSSDEEIEAAAPPHRPRPLRSAPTTQEGRMCGAARAFATQLTVPGGSTVPCAAVTSVGVLPTHIRRGHLTRLMRTQLDDVAERGEPVAALIAAEYPIYGRYGYGPATEAITLRVDTAAATWRDEAVGAVELVDAETWGKITEELYERVRVTVPGHLQRDSAFWRIHAGLDPSPWGDGDKAKKATARRVA